MAPLLQKFSTTNTSKVLREQFSDPTDVFSVLLILGTDVINRALAQLTGDGFAPVSFSFGWVGYSVSALGSALGRNNLLPLDPDCKCKVINGRSGHAIDNCSWVLGRFMRDFPKWNEEAIVEKTNEILDRRWKELKGRDPRAPRPSRAGLVVSIYEPRQDRIAGVPQKGLLYWSGLAIIVLQLGICLVPLLRFGDWGILVIVSAGIILCIATGLLPQWKDEKWACRRNSNDTYVVTRGNGAQHAIAIIGNGHGLNLEDLAAGQANMDLSHHRLTRIALPIFAVLWVVLLIMASGLKTNTWFLLAIGGVGMVQNIVVAGCNRRPEHLGIHLRLITVIGCTKVMKALLAVEEEFPKLGRSLRDEFFPGGLREGEKETWDRLAEKTTLVKNSIL